MNTIEFHQDYPTKKGGAAIRFLKDNNTLKFSLNSSKNLLIHDDKVV